MCASDKERYETSIGRTEITAIGKVRIHRRTFALCKERKFGTIEPGKLADITVVKGNPLFDIVALANVDVVVKDGVPYRDSTRLEPN
jgi:hypothetical protein